jgi:hypothetical protein
LRAGRWRERPLGRASPCKRIDAWVALSIHTFMPWWLLIRYRANILGHPARQLSRSWGSDHMVSCKFDMRRTVQSE